MKLKTLVATALFVALTIIIGGKLIAAQSVEDEIRDLETKMNAAYAQNDLPAYFAYYATDFTQWLPEGRTDLAKYKDDWTKYIGAGNKVQSAEVKELQIRLSPQRDAAVASYLLVVKTKLADGKISEERNQETDVWFKRDGAWKVVALHYAPAGK